MAALSKALASFTKSSFLPRGKIKDAGVTEIRLFTTLTPYFAATASASFTKFLPKVVIFS